jgi:hypothetical protein
MVKAAEIRNTELSERAVQRWGQAREAFLQYVFQVWERRKKSVLKDDKGCQWSGRTQGRVGRVMQLKH